MNKLHKQIEEAFQFRYACKRFDPDKTVSETDFHTIIESARFSPSSFGFEPWKFLVVRDRALLEKLRLVSWGAQGQFPTASHVVIILARKMVDTEAHSDYIAHVMRDIQLLPIDVQEGKREKFATFQQEDFDLTDERKLFDWACKQTYIALGNMMTVAALLGVDSCPIEGFNREQFEKILVDEGILDTQHFGVSVLVAFGYRAPDTTLHPKTRGAAEDLIRWID